MFSVFSVLCRVLSVLGVVLCSLCCAVFSVLCCVLYGCDFNHSHISYSSIRCFVASPQHVTYRAVLSGTPSVSTVEVTSLIHQWITTTDYTHETIRVQSVELDVNSTCPLVIVDFDAPDCPESILLLARLQV